MLCKIIAKIHEYAGLEGAPAWTGREENVMIVAKCLL